MSRRNGKPKADAKGWFQGIGRLRAWIIGIGAVAGALTAVVAFLFMLFPALKPVEPSVGAGATLTISRVEPNVAFGEYLERPGVPGEEVEKANQLSEEQLVMVGNAVYFALELEGFARKRVYLRWSVYDADTKRPVNGLTNRSAWPTDVVTPGHQSSRAELETWVPYPESGQGPYSLWLEMYTEIDGEESRLDSDEAMLLSTNENREDSRGSKNGEVTSQNEPGASTLRAPMQNEEANSSAQAFGTIDLPKNDRQVPDIPPPELTQLPSPPPPAPTPVPVPIPPEQQESGQD